MHFQVSIIEAGLSDGSKVYGVRITDEYEEYHFEFSAVAYDDALLLQEKMVGAIELHTTDTAQAV